MKDELIALSPTMRQAVGAALDVASTPTTVLITGETGTGKEVLARFIHQMSARVSLPFTVITGALVDFDALDAALKHAGTVLLDEIGSLPLDMQSRLLTLLEAPHASRIIATSHRNLKEAVERGQLRSDLYYRLDVFPIAVPPLRERREDLAPLADILLHRASAHLGRVAPQLSGEALGLLETQRWPGNVRELANVVERATIRARGPVIDVADLGLVAPPSADPGVYPAHFPLDLAQLERLAMAEALRRTSGNRTHAARLLNIGLRTLRQKLNTPSRPDTEELLLEAAS